MTCSRRNSDTLFGGVARPIEVKILGGYTRQGTTLSRSNRLKRQRRSLRRSQKSRSTPRSRSRKYSRL